MDKIDFYLCHVTWRPRACTLIHTKHSFGILSVLYGYSINKYIPVRFVSLDLLQDNIKIQMKWKPIFFFLKQLLFIIMLCATIWYTWASINCIFQTVPRMWQHPRPVRKLVYFLFQRYCRCLFFCFFLFPCIQFLYDIFRIIYSTLSSYCSLTNDRSHCLSHPSLCTTLS